MRKRQKLALNSVRQVDFFSSGKPTNPFATGCLARSLLLPASTERLVELNKRKPLVKLRLDEEFLELFDSGMRVALSAQRTGREARITSPVQCVRDAVKQQLYTRRSPTSQVIVNVACLRSREV